MQPYMPQQPVVYPLGVVPQQYPQPVQPQPVPNSSAMVTVPLHPVSQQMPAQPRSERAGSSTASADLAFASESMTSQIQVNSVQNSNDEAEEEEVKCWELSKWSRAAWVKFLLFLCLVGGIIVLFTAVDVFAHLERFSNWAEDNQATGLLSFMGIYAVLTVVCFPGAFLTIAAGLVFGVAKGVLATLVGATIGATLAFLVGRYLFKDVADGFTKKYKAMKAVNTVVSRSAFRFTFLIRLSPIIPFTALNYCLSLTSVSLFSYVGATLFGIAPGTVLFVYLGSTVMSLMEIQEGKVQQDTRTQILFWVGLAVTILVTVVITRLARNQIRKEVAESEAEIKEAENADNMEAGQKEAAAVPNGTFQAGAGTMPEGALSTLQDASTDSNAAVGA